jgi:ubiquinone/menaquinone biosynthesis C-methylase UbiE
LPPDTKPYRSDDRFERFLERLERQADRTRAFRAPLYKDARLSSARRVLDVGCGSGHVTLDLCRGTRGRVTAIDNDPAMVKAAATVLAGTGNATVEQADAHRLPFADATFDLVVANLFFMWAQDPPKAAREMTRVLKPGGRVLASMEPDYGGKIHFPENPVIDQVFQGGMIERKGGDAHAGRKLRTYLVQAGLETRVGLSNPGIPSCEEDLESFDREKSFYRRALKEAGLSAPGIREWEREYLASLRAGTQFNFLPLFYALGTKKQTRRGRSKD